jgi:glycosyltransferase involved in cell wall biosynthesis
VSFDRRGRFPKTQERADCSLRVVTFFSYGMSLATWRKNGIADRELDRYKRLAARLGEVTLVTYDRTSPLLPAGCSLRVIYNRWGLPRSLFSILAPFLCGRQIMRANVLLSHQMAGSWAAVLAGIIWRKPVVVRQGYLLGENLRRSHARWSKRVVVRMVEYLAYRFADAVISTVPPVPVFGRPQLAAVRVIPNGIDTGRFNSNSLAVPRESPVRVLFVGRLNAFEKNLENLIRAASGAGFQLRVIGEGRDRQTLQRLADAEGADISFVGAVPNEDIPRALADADIFALPSRFEGNPKALLEAMSCRVPVVTTHWEGAEKIIQDGENGVFCEPDAASIKSALQRLASDPEWRLRIGVAARKTVLENYDLDRQIEDEANCIMHAVSRQTS